MLSPVKIWRNQKKTASLIGKTGKIVSWSVVRVPPADFTDQAPYPVVLVQIDGGKRIMAQLVDYDQKNLRYGQNVATVIRRVVKPNSEGVILYGVKVTPI